MGKFNLNVDIAAVKKELEQIRTEKTKLDNLYTKIERSKDELINSNTSGKTVTACIENNQSFQDTIKDRISSLNNLINKLDYICKSYETEWNFVNESITGTSSVEKEETKVK